MCSSSRKQCGRYPIEKWHHSNQELCRWLQEQRGICQETIGVIYKIESESMCPTKRSWLGLEYCSLFYHCVLEQENCPRSKLNKTSISKFMILALPLMATLVDTHREIGSTSTSHGLVAAQVSSSSYKRQVSKFTYSHSIVQISSLRNMASSSDRASPLQTQRASSACPPKIQIVVEAHKLCICIGTESWKRCHPSHKAFKFQCFH